MKIPAGRPPAPKVSPATTPSASAPSTAVGSTSTNVTSTSAAASARRSGRSDDVAATFEGKTGSAGAMPSSPATHIAPAATATSADIQQAKSATDALRSSADPTLRDLGETAGQALGHVAKHVEKAAVLEVPLRARLATARADRMPQMVAGVLKDGMGAAGPKVTFYPADESIHPFDVDPRLAAAMPRNTLLLARATKRKDDDGAAFYRLNGERPPLLRGSFTGVVDIVDGRPFVRDLVKSPPTFHPLPERDPATGTPWQPGTVLAAHVPPGQEDGRAEVVVDARLAEGGTAQARSWTVAAAQRLDPTFPAQALDEARAIAADLRLDDRSLVDLTHEPFFAIDNHGSRDIDQAMRLTKKPDGGFVLQYALADMSSYVKPGMALWDEAMERGASFYIPGISVPMQPTDVCERAVSLNAHEVHRALVVTVELDKDGNVTKSSSALAKIQSRAQLTYPGVSEHLERGTAIATDEHGKPVPREVIEQLATFEALGTVLRGRARARGVVETERREMRIGLDGARFLLHDAKGDVASLLNAELSILANCAAASLLAKPGLPGIQVPGVFRVHSPPPPEKLGALRRQLAAIVDAHGAPPSWKWQKEETLAAWVERLRALPTTPRERSLSRALQGQVLGIQVSSEYARSPDLHSGLMVEGYGRFTAPMREAVGVLSHATLVQLESLKRVAVLFDEDHPALAPLWDHMLLGALVDPKQLDAPRAALAGDAVALAGLRGEELRQEAQKLFDRVMAAPPLGVERDHVERAVNRALEAGNQSRMKQRQAETASLRLLFDDLFLSDLRGVPEGDPNNPAPTRSGTVTMVSPGKICVQLDDPEVEVRIGREDLKRGAGESLLLDNEGAVLRCSCPGQNERRLLIGQEVKVRATYHDGEKLHFTVVD